MKSPYTLPACAIVGFLAAASANAQVVTKVFEFPPNAGVSLLFGWFGDDNGPFEGEIINTRVFIEYQADAPLDAADFYTGFSVPVLDPLGGSEFLYIDAEVTDWSGSGTFLYELQTNAFNGVLRPGRFGWEVDGGGQLLPGSRIEFDVRLIPAAPSFAAFAAFGTLAALRRRR